MGLQNPEGLATNGSGETCLNAADYQRTTSDPQSWECPSEVASHAPEVSTYQTLSSVVELYQCGAD